MKLDGLLQILPRAPRLRRGQHRVVEPAGDLDRRHRLYLAQERERRKQETIAAFLAAEEPRT